MASSLSVIFPALSLSTTASLTSIQKRHFLSTLLFPSHRNKSKPLALVASKKNFGMVEATSMPSWDGTEIRFPSVLPYYVTRSNAHVVVNILPKYDDNAPRTISMGMNEDMDDVLDDLFEKHGKVVFRSTDQKPVSKEASDDAESLSFAVALAKVASDVKASEIRLLFVKPLVYWTRFFIIATAFSRPQIDAISSKIRDVAEKQFNKVASGDTKANSWTLLDFGDVVVHIFLPQQREFYNLEEFYGNATSIELPFDSESSSRS